MKLQRLILKNFGMFRGVRQIDLDSELVVVFGANFSGKSTLARAIYFTLCGKVLTTGMKPPALVRTDEMSATTGLFYTHGSHSFRIYRSTKNDLQIEQNVAENWQRIQETGNALPALNPQQWRIGCFLREDELGEFLVQQPASRRDLLNQLLGVERILQAQEAFIRVRRLAKRREKDALSVQKSLRFDKSQDCSAELDECRKLISRLQAQVQTTGKDDESSAQLLTEWQQARSNLQLRKEAVNNELAGIQAGFNSLTELKTALEEITVRLQERDNCAQEFEKQTEARIIIAAKLQQTEELLSGLTALKGEEKCPTCRQPLAPEHVETLLGSLQKERDEQTAALEEARKQEAEARETVNLLDELAKRESDLKQRAERWLKLESELSEVQQQLEKIETKINSADSQAGAGFDRVAAQQDLQNEQSRLSSLEAQQALFEQNQQEIQQANQNAEKATQHRLLSEWAADAVAKTLQEVVGLSLERAGQEISATLQQFDLFQQRRQSINLEKSQLMPDVDGRVLQSLSGSEKAILYLSLKIALSRLTPGADFLVLDDPTTHLDGQRSKLLADFLASLAPEKQVIVLTNDLAFAEMMTGAKRVDL